MAKVMTSRALLFVPHLKAIKKPKYRTKIPKNRVKTWVGLIASWFEFAEHDHPNLNKPEIHVRYHQQCPITLPPFQSDCEEEDKELASQVHQGLILGLERSTFNFFHAGQKNTVTKREAYTSKLLGELEHHLDHSRALLDDIPALNSFRADLLSMIQDVPGLESYTGWFQTPEVTLDSQELSALLKEQDDDTVATALMKKREDDLQTKLDQAFTQIGAVLNQQGLAGVDLEDLEEQGVHSFLEPRLWELYKAGSHF
jgi:hypothetical protein